MYDEIIHLAMDQQLLSEIRERDTVINYKKLPLWRELQKNVDTSEFEMTLREQNRINFDEIFFNEPVGYHLIKAFLINEHSVDKAVFLSDVQVFKTLQDPSAREKVAIKIFDRFCAPETDLDINISINPVTGATHASTYSLVGGGYDGTGDGGGSGGGTNGAIHVMNTRIKGMSVFEKGPTIILNENEDEEADDDDGRGDDDDHTHTGGAGSSGGGSSKNRHRGRTDTASSRHKKSSKKQSRRKGRSGSTIMTQSGFEEDTATADFVVAHPHPDSSHNGPNNPHQSNAQDGSDHESTYRDKTMGGTGVTKENGMIEYRLSLLTENTNSIGVYGRPIKRLKRCLETVNIVQPNVFDEVCSDVINDLRLDVFPRFVRSKWFEMYLKCKMYIESRTKAKKISQKEFHKMRMLGRGAFGAVSACKKKDTGKLYAMKQISKKRVKGTDSVTAIMAERNFLAAIGVATTDCRFVTTLKYAFMDETTLYLVIPLMMGGDLKFHLNHEKTFNEDRSRFYAAQVLLGLEHIHKKEIVYRDLKLENVLMDDRGDLQLSDLGLAVRMRDTKTGLKKYVRGYAGTPGYTAPEVVLGHYYDHVVDYFSLGVMIYRFLCGRKPFETRRSRRHRGNRDKRQNQTAELDRNVVEMEPFFPPEYFSANARSLIKGLLCKNAKRRLGYHGIADIKEHPWFDMIDFGLLEAGYLDPPFAPNLEQIHAEGQQDIGRPPKDMEWENVKINAEFDKQLDGFLYVNGKIIQEEIVEVLKKINATERHSNGHQSHDTMGEIPFLGGDMDNDRRGRGCMSACELM